MENEHPVGSILTVARDAWRQPVSFEDPIDVGAIASRYRSLVRPTSLVPLTLVHDGSDFETSLRAGLQAYNSAQVEHPELAHIQYELFHGPDGSSVRATRVWNGASWEPARLLLDTTITLDDVRGTCAELVVQIFDEALKRVPDADAGWSSSQKQAHWGSFSLQVPCALDGTAPARVHLGRLKEQVEAASAGEPWFTTFSIDEGPRTEGEWPVAYRIQLRPLDQAENRYDRYRLDESVFGYRVPRDSKRPPPLRKPKRGRIAAPSGAQ